MNKSQLRSVVNFLRAQYTLKPKGQDTICIEKNPTNLNLSRVEFETILKKLNDKAVFTFVYFEFFYLRSNKTDLAYTSTPNGISPPISVKNDEDIKYLIENCFTLLVDREFDQNITNTLS